MKSSQSTTLVELHIPNFELAKEFYGKLGFKEVWERKPEGFKGYLVMKLEKNIICFWGGNSQILKHAYFQQFSKSTHRGYGVELVLVVSNLIDFYEKAKKFAKVVEPMQKRPWGLKDFRIEDPFGFYLRFTTPHDVTDSRYAVK